jgi:hypothetical protein
MKIIELVQNKKWSDVKSYIEKTAATEIYNRIQEKKQEILDKVRGTK